MDVLDGCKPRGSAGGAYWQVTRMCSRQRRLNAHVSIFAFYKEIIDCVTWVKLLSSFLKLSFFFWIIHSLEKFAMGFVLEF